ncbi:low-affinity Cu transporter [Aspergillus melleus]|uniref:low-affinity Cu transporter n=1 Tax=Aspergillus melleus TaxID=138277 RepID=UPI001E8D63A5|nr:copper transpport protein [Aspergillus melleus]KAH8426735.1 copper transpport protein [Aspergillus melleus]
MDHHAMHHDMDMDHGGHGGHGDMDMGEGQCSMNMLFTWSSKGLCIVFRQWQVTGLASLLGSLVVIVLLTAGYEGVRQLTRRFETAHARRLNAFTSSATTGGNDFADDPAPDGSPYRPATHLPDASSPLLVGSDNRRRLEQRGKIIMALLYAVQVFYSFFIMLLFMTYNGWVMISVAIGAFVGYLVFGDNTSASKTVACH